MKRKILQRLLDPAEEQFDLPTLFVKVRNLCRRSVEIIGDDAQHLAGIDNHPDLPNWYLQRVFAAVGKPLRQMTDTITENIAILGDAVLMHHCERGVFLQPRHEATASIIELRPPPIIVKPEVVDVGRARFDRHRFGRRDVVDVGRRDRKINRAIRVRIIDDMRFDPCTVLQKNVAQSALKLDSRTLVESMSRTASPAARRRPRCTCFNISVNRSLNTCHGRSLLASDTVERFTGAAPK